jgi:DNA-binding response OmpR family regulator
VVLLQSKGGARRILAVDGDAQLRDLLKLHLANAGYEVLLAEDAIVAGPLLLRLTPDLLIVEAKLPYMSGVEFIATLRADGSIPRVPAILIGERENLAADAKALDVGYLVKPFSVDRLLDLVAQALRVQKQSSRVAA